MQLYKYPFRMKKKKINPITGLGRPSGFQRLRLPQNI
jgi:hypothetical protein